jgi:multiple sugar transport system substrate-binding protein
MNALRAFKTDEIAAVGGAWDFMAPVWDASMLPGDKNIWSIPWTGWIYVICYRKDLLQEAGIDPDEAFGTARAVKETIARLVSSSLEIPWLYPQLPLASRDLLYASPRDLLHIAASWVWAADADFMNKEGTKILINSPQAMEGLKDWLDIYRAVPAAYKTFGQQETLAEFREGRAAAVLTNIYGANTLIDMQDNPVVRENLGVASVTEVPWAGGGSFVIWQHVRGNPQQEHAAVELVKFLASKEINLRYRHEVGSMPSRIDALKEAYPEGNPARNAVMLAATKGRGYYNTPTWRRIEQQLSEEIGAVALDASENVSADSASILYAHLDPVAQHLNNTLGT